MLQVQDGGVFLVAKVTKKYVFGKWLIINGELATHTRYFPVDCRFFCEYSSIKLTGNKVDSIKALYL